MRKNKLLTSLSTISAMLVLGAFLIVSCDKQNDITPRKKTINIYCDNAASAMIKPLLSLYDSVFINNNAVLIDTTAWGAVAAFLSSDSVMSLVSRNFSDKEDSLINEFNLKHHLNQKFAQDALVFFVHHSYPLDTLNLKQIEKIFTDKDRLTDFFPNLKTEPEYVVNDFLSSEYANFKELVLKGKQKTKALKPFSSADSVINYIKNNPQNIGIGYLSQIIKDPDLRPLRIGFTDTAGNYIFPKPVHQAVIVQGLYPFIVTHYIYFTDKSNDIKMQFVRFLTKSAIAQGYFNDYGIVPTYAKIRLIREN